MGTRSVAVRTPLWTTTLAAIALCVWHFSGCAIDPRDENPATAAADVTPPPATVVAGETIARTSNDEDPASPASTADAGSPAAPANDATSDPLPTSPSADPPWTAVTGIGLWPRSYTPSGMASAIEQTALAADLGMVQVPLTWDPLRGDITHAEYRANYDYLVKPATPGDGNLFEQQGLGKVVLLDFLESTDRRVLNLHGLPGSESFTDPTFAAAYVTDCVWLADYWDADYIALGTEIDEYLRVVSSSERAALLAAFIDARNQIKAQHPQASVFMYFQYENVVARQLWNLIRPFALESDLAAFSTYPSLPVAGAGRTAASLDAVYYAAIHTQLGTTRRPAFVELGHPAGASNLFPAGSPSEQDAFITRFFAVAPRDTALVVWSHLYDPDYGSVYTTDIAAYFGAMGLLRRDGGLITPAWNTWLAVQTLTP